MKIVYLHGFASGSNSEKGRLLRTAYSASHEVVTPALSSHPEIALKQIAGLIDTAENNIIFVGSSLGGFYADYFNRKCRIPAVLINPLVDPDDIRQFIGVNINFATGEEFAFTGADCDFLAGIAEEKRGYNTADSPEFVLIAEDDELLDVEKTKKYFIHKNQKVTSLPVGTHRFLNPSLVIETVDALINRLLKSGV
ncbi:MAG: YqiA/YcfP family alpha/beta fold hydrolase [Spirochaetota bacterium]